MQVERLKLTSAIVVAGEIVRAGNLVEVTPSEARDLLRRGKAVRDTSDRAVDAVSVAADVAAAEVPLHPVIAQHQQDEADRAARAELASQGESDAGDTAMADAATEAPAEAPKRRGRPPAAANAQA